MRLESVLQAVGSRVLARELGNGLIGDAFRERGIERLDEAAEFVRALPYGRTRNPRDVLAVLVERRGTCSSKHVLLKVAADEAEAGEVRLMLGFFEMSESTHPAVAGVLERLGLACVPEAHCYLSHRGARLDFTGVAPGPQSPFSSLFSEREVSVAYVLAEKTVRHRHVSDAWSREHSLDPAAVWAAREECIRALSAGPEPAGGGLRRG